MATNSLNYAAAEVVSGVPTAVPAVEGAFQASTTAIVVLACKRAHYLRETMAGLLALNGVDRYKCAIWSDLI